MELAFALPKANMHNWGLFEQLNEAAFCLSELSLLFFKQSLLCLHNCSSASQVLWWLSKILKPVLQ